MTAPAIVGFPGTIGFLGNATPRNALGRRGPRADKTLQDHHCHDFREAGLNSLRQHVTEHPAGGCLAAGW
ncbi:MAG: hypothetical protein NTV33_01015 [Coprothermobacterota bacterium]|nr:hypothetical protein [Coprothermobacterota bacterium]